MITVFHYSSPVAAAAADPLAGLLQGCPSPPRPTVSIITRILKCVRISSVDLLLVFFSVGAKRSERFGLVITSLGVSTKLLYVEPG